MGLRGPDVLVSHMLFSRRNRQPRTPLLLLRRLRKSADVESLIDTDCLTARRWPSRCGVCCLGFVPLIRPWGPMLFQWLTSKQAENRTRPAGHLPPTHPPLCCHPFGYICERDLWVFVVTCLLWSCWEAISLKLLQKEHQPPCEESRSR